MTDDRMQFMTIVCDGTAMWEPLVPWILVLLSTIPAVRCLFLSRHANPERARRTARRCYLALHLLFAVLALSVIWLVIPLCLLGLPHFLATSALFPAQCIQFSHALWPVMFGLIVTQVSALVVALRTGIQPHLWQPRGTLTSMFFCALAQAGVLWMITSMIQS
jgi:hypothetical protein